MYDRFGDRECSINATVGQAGVIRNSGSAAIAGPGRSTLAGGRGAGTGMSHFDPSKIDFSKKILHIDWHPRLPLTAVAGLNNLFTFCASDERL